MKLTPTTARDIVRLARLGLNGRAKEVRQHLRGMAKRCQAADPGLAGQLTELAKQDSDDDAREQEDTWTALKAALNDGRIGQRKLFP